MVIKGRTDIGKKRKVNEDSYFAEQIKDLYLAVVCDGVGGLSGGNIASSTALKIFIATFNELIEQSVNYKDIMYTAVARANDEVYSLSLKEKKRQGMGTTMVACVFDGTEFLIANVGDSRMYVIDDKNYTIRQVTKDHSLVQNLIENGKLTKKQAESYPNKNVITRAIGIEDYIDVDFYMEKYSSGVILLCSDGLYNYVSEEDLVNYISQYDDIENCIDCLIAKANENGGGDNITVVIIKP